MIPGNRKSVKEMEDEFKESWLAARKRTVGYVAWAEGRTKEG
jgi:hypothetical protein